MMRACERRPGAPTRPSRGSTPAKRAAIAVASGDERTLTIVGRELRKRYATDYDIALHGDRERARAWLQDLREQGAPCDGREQLSYLRIRDHSTGTEEVIAIDGLFLLIGSVPRTKWLRDAVARDDWGFVLTGPDLAEQWSRERPPLLLETSMPGVFAVGDVRRGSIKRVASAVGEGSIVIQMVYRHDERQREEARTLHGSWAAATEADG
jgi:hypothetical protein